MAENMFETWDVYMLLPVNVFCKFPPSFEETLDLKIREMPVAVCLQRMPACLPASLLQSIRHLGTNISTDTGLLVQYCLI